MTKTQLTAFRNCFEAGMDYDTAYQCAGISDHWLHRWLWAHWSALSLRHEYRPYDKLPEFDEGMAAYAKGIYENPYDDLADGGRSGIAPVLKAQAWDRGRECAMRIKNG